MFYEVEVADTDIRFPCGEEETVFEAMRRAGKGPVHYGCFGGGCGVCRMRIVSGPYTAVKKMSRAHVSETEQEEGVVLLCCVKPRGNLAIARV